MTGRNTISNLQKSQYSIQHFGFSSRGFVNFYYNALISCWASTIEKVMMPALVEEGDDPAAVDQLRARLLKRIFQHGKLDTILGEVQTYLSRYVFFIPSHVTLPEDLPKLELPGKPEVLEAQMKQKIDELEKEIMELRYKLEVLKRKRKGPL